VVTPRVRRAWIVVLLAGSLAALIPQAWRAGAERSALSTSYSTAVAHGPSVVGDAYEMLSGAVLFRKTAARLVAAPSTDRERLTTLMEWVHDNVRPQYAAPARLVPDSALGIVRRGHGYCDQSAHVFATLAHFAGYDVHLLFLRAADGASPHAVAEVRVDDRWVLVDPWLGLLVVDHAGRLAGAAELGTTAAVPLDYALLGANLDGQHFRRGTPFETFPYLSLSALGLKVWRRLTSENVATVTTEPRPAERPTEPTTAPRAPAARPPTVPRDDLLEMDGARRAHLEGRYETAIAGYRHLLVHPLPPDMAESVRFFLGLALLRAGSTEQAVLVFDAALEAAPRTAWRPSVLYYRAEARAQAGDVDGAAVDLRAANIPPAERKLDARQRRGRP
jgi:hypothetical protein